MAGAMRKAMVYLGLVEEDDRYQYDEYDQPTRPTATTPSRRPRRAGPAPTGPPAPTRCARSGTRSVATMPARNTLAGARALRPDHDDPPAHLQRGQADRRAASATSTPVIMNLSDMDDSDAKRLVDFAAGLVFGLRGTSSG